MLSLVSCGVPERRRLGNRGRVRDEVQQEVRPESRDRGHLGVVGQQRQGIAEGVDAEPFDAASARPEEQRCLVAEDLVDGPGCEEGAEDLRPALDEQVADAFGMQSVEGLGIDTLGDALRLLPDDTEVPAVSRLGPDFLLHFVADSAPAP